MEDVLVGDGEASVLLAKESRGDGALEDGKNVEGGELALLAGLEGRDGGGAAPALVEAVEHAVALVEGQPRGLRSAVERLVEHRQLAVGEVEHRHGVVVVRGGVQQLRSRGGDEERGHKGLGREHPEHVGWWWCLGTVGQGTTVLTSEGQQREASPGNGPAGALLY